MSWQQDFKDHTTGGVFNLNLTGQMILGLAFIESGDYNSLVSHVRCIPMVKALRNRGLIDRDEKVPPGSNGWYLTMAGHHVFELLKLAGLVTWKEKEEAA